MEQSPTSILRELLEILEQAFKDKSTLHYNNLELINLCKKKSPDFLKTITERLQKKKISYIRHAQSGYNAWKSESFMNLITPYANTVENYDPSITEKGQEQCKALVPVLDVEMKEKVELVLISPLRRAIETYVAVKDAKMIAECSNIVITPLLRERLDTPCDIGTPLTMLKEIFSAYNYDFLVRENWWSPNLEFDVKNRLETKFVKENVDRVRDRIFILLIWLALREEENILLVAHSNYYDAIAEKFRFISPNIKNAEMKVLPGESLAKFVTKYLKL